MILVTHDVELLKSMDHIAEVIPGATGSLQLYKSCTYEQYLELKDQRAAAAQTEYERNKEKAAQLQAFVDRFGASATKASAAQSRVKQIEKMRQQGLLDAPADAVVAQRFRPTLRLPAPPKAVGHVLVRLEDADVGYDTPLVRDVTLEICKGMKILVRGPNGSGKSTVLHALRGTLPLLHGKREENHDLCLGMFTQDLAQELDPNERAVDIVTSYAREGNMHISDQDARGALGGLGLQGEKALRRLVDLSGGEKARVALAMFSLKPSNVYFLDGTFPLVFHSTGKSLRLCCSTSPRYTNRTIQPSRYRMVRYPSLLVVFGYTLTFSLTLPFSVEALGAALRGWGDDKGAIVVVSHDKHFCSNIEFSHVITVNDECIKIEQRAARESDWKIQSMAFNDGSMSSSLETSDAPAEQAPTMDASLRKKAFNAPKRIAKLEGLIEKAEMEIAEIEEEMIANGSDVGKLVDLTKEKDALSEKVESYMAEWEELESLLSLV